MSGYTAKYRLENPEYRDKEREKERIACKQKSKEEEAYRRKNKRGHKHSTTKRRNYNRAKQHQQINSFYPSFPEKNDMRITQNIKLFQIKIKCRSIKNQ